ncbi:MAG: methylmalonyl-CoA epimerase [Proteobacteria bacterium]|nr:methylmalonyl-CoA epimerase [Pseudomonadota bacterium]
MIGKLNHIAIAVPDLGKATEFYHDVLGARVSDPKDLPQHGVTTVFVELENTKLELLYPLGENSPIAGFLEKNSAGGIHHYCLEVENIDAAIEQAKAHDIRVLGNGSPQVGAHGKPVIFIHPKDALGCLVEFEEI